MHPKTLLDRSGHHPKKRLGQNFLVDEDAARRIAQRVCANASRVLEIGPGTGALTLALLECDAAITAVEIDPDMVAILRAQPELQRAQIVNEDALTFDYAAYAAGRPWHVTGNLPYHIATALVMQLIEMREGPQMLVVMVQREVAERFAAQPGTAAYGSLSIAVRYAMEVAPLFTLRPDSFYPRPKIESSVVVLTRRERPAVSVRDERRFWQVVRGAFAYRRKTLANGLSLAIGVDRAAAAAALQQIGLPAEIRGERLDLADFARLADQLPG